MNCKEQIIRLLDKLDDRALEFIYRIIKRILGQSRISLFCFPLKAHLPFLPINPTDLRPYQLTSRQNGA